MNSADKKSMHIEPLFEMNSLSFKYGSRTILRDINLSVQPGTFTCLIGPSGSGKSTLLYILGGFLKPYRGDYKFKQSKVYLLGELGLGRFRRKNIGFLFQDFRLLPFLSAEKNISLPAFFSGQKVTKQAKETIMKDLGIFERRKSKPSQLSGGEAQRVALARALLLNPSLLLLDEPTGNLDVDTEREILSILLEYKKRGLTLFCITHSRAVMAAADNIIALGDGTLQTKKISDINISEYEKVSHQTRSADAPANSRKKNNKTSVKSAAKKQSNASQAKKNTIAKRRSGKKNV